VEYCLRACQQSTERASYAEAVGQFETGLARLQELPDDERRTELELDLRNAVYLPLATLKGYGSPEGERAAARALELSRRPGVSWEKSWMALYGLFLTTLIRASGSRASELATQMLAIAEQHGNNVLTAQSFSALALSQMLLGRFESADKSFDRAISMYETTLKATTGLGSLRNMNAVAGYGTSAWNTWFLGFQTRAAKKMDDALAMARVLDSKAVEEMIHYPATVFFSLVRERERTREHADALVILATELGNPSRRALGEFQLGWFDSVTCDRPAGIARMQHALADFRATGSVTMMSWFLSLLAQSQGGFGHYDEALVAIDEALVVIEGTGERFFEAEVHRTKGELLSAKDASNAIQAEQSFRTAIEIARRQKGKSWELRATMSFARLLRDTNRRDEARVMLAEIYNWFTEGFDTGDLKDAKALLDELN
jgi:tetratricopeptide (TPR) repeat protein